MTRKMRAQSGFEIGFILFAIFYYGFVTFFAAAWPGATGMVTGEIVVPVLPPAPGVLDYLFWALNMAWFYASTFWAFNINVPLVGLISLTLVLGVGYVIAKLIRG